MPKTNQSPKQERLPKKSQPPSFALINFDELPSSATVKLAVIAAHRNESESTVRRRIADGTLPPLIQLGPRSVGMNVGQYREVMAAKQKA